MLKLDNLCKQKYQFAKMGASSMSLSGDFHLNDAVGQVGVEPSDKVGKWQPESGG